MLLGPAVWLIGAAGMDEAEAANDPLVVNFRDQRLTVRANAISLRTVLEAVGRLTGVEMALGASAEETIIASFDALPLDDAVRRLLRQKSYVLMYTATRSGQPRAVLTKVRILGEGSLEELGSQEDPLMRGQQRIVARAERIGPAQVMEPARAGDLEATMLELLQALEQEKSGPKRAASHGLEALETAPTGLLATIARQDRDPMTRLAALRLLVRRGAEEPQVRAVVEEASTTDPDYGVQDMATALLKEFFPGL
jgi:hypothetical protein